jgi:glycerol kinase
MILASGGFCREMASGGPLRLGSRVFCWLDGTAEAVPFPSHLELLCSQFPQIRSEFTEVSLAYVLALDQGTTSSRAIVFDHDGAIRAVAQREFEQIFPEAGWVEHDPEEIWASQISVAIEALSRTELRPRDIAAIGITNQRETTIVWDRETGKPIYNAIVWQDRRTAAFCDQLKAAGHEALIQERTGLLIDSYFSGTKIRWILDHVADARRLADAGRLAFGTIDSWLVWKLTSGRLHITDISNASRTMLFNIHTCEWDEDILGLLQIPASMLPVVRGSSEVYSEVTTTMGLGSIAIAGIAGDQQASLFGQRCISPGLTKNTYGTGCFLLQNIGARPVASSNRLITTVAWKIGDVVEYALEGSVFIGGAVVQWLRDGLHLIKDSREIEALANSVPDNGGVYMVPAFVGLGAPHWDQYARGCIFGLTRSTGAGHLARAALESIAFQVADVLDAMQRDAGTPLPELRVDGGAAANETLLQFQADILGIPVVRPAVMETTALGVAYLAGLAVGFWRDADAIAAIPRAEKRFEPDRPRGQSKALRKRWNEALCRAKGWEANP